MRPNRGLRDRDEGPRGDKPWPSEAMAVQYRIAVSPWYHPYQPFSGIDRAMASWHGIEGRKPDFAKTQGQTIRFGVCFYLDESSEADIQPSLYNQTFSIIFQASRFFQNFIFLRISYFRNFRSGQYLEGKNRKPKILKYEILKNIKFQKNWEA